MNQHNTFFVHLQSLVLRRNSGALRPFLYPLREWIVCLCIATIVGIVLFGHAALDFNNQLNDRDIPEVTGEQIPRYSPEEAEHLLNYYEGKTRVFSALRQNKPVLPATPEGAPAEESKLPVEN